MQYKPSKTLWNRHVVNKAPVFCDPQQGPSYYLNDDRRWLKTISITRKQLDTYFLKVRAAARVLGITPGGVKTAISKGKLGTPLYDYSAFSDAESYQLWVHKAAVVRYARTRK